MAGPRHPKILSSYSVTILLSLCLLGSFYAQNPSPSPLPPATPTASVTPLLPPVPTPTPTPLPGAQNFHQWGSITVFNGLPSDSVRAIAQTPDGVMWFGTDNGLARFDGRRIQNFQLGGDDAASVLALKTSGEGELLIGTRAGAFELSDGEFRAVENTPGRGISTILISEKIYLGTADGFIMSVTRGGDRSLSAQNINSSPIRSSDGRPIGITSVIEIRGNIVAGTSGGGAFEIKNGAASELQTSPRPLFVNALAQSGSLWIGTDAPRGLSGVYLNANGRRAERISAPTSKVLALEAEGGDVWAGTERYGLFHFADSKLKKSYTFSNTSGGLRSDTIYALFTDREGVLWIGTNRGVSRFDSQGPFQETVSEIPNSNFIRTLWQSSDRRALFAGSNRGLFYFDGKNWLPVNGFDGAVVYVIGQNAGSGLIGTSTGTYKLTGNAGRLFTSKGSLLTNGDSRSLEVFRDKTYAAILGRGVVDISSSRQVVIFPEETACSLLAMDDRLWIGTVGKGLYSFDGKEVNAEISPSILKSGAIWKITRDAERNIWIAGEHGVFRAKDGEIEQIIAAEDVRDVFVSGADVWAATTTRGLLHARHDERFGWLVSAIGFEQGLPSEKAFAIIPGDDGLLIATNRGVVTYRRSDIPPKLIATRILSQRVHDPSELKSGIALEFPQNSLLVEVAGQSSRTFPEEFQYAFVLTNARGEELDRVVSNDPQYAPKELKPGNYTIESIAFNRDLIATEPLYIRFSVAKSPFPWTATALGVLLVLALAGLVWAFIEHKRITHRNRELAAARLDLANEAERERRRIARDLHDQTLADLRSLMMKSDRGTLSGPEFREEVEAVSTEIRRICEDLSPSVLENVGLVAALEFLLSRTAENHRFSADESIEEKISFPLNVQLQIYRIAQEVLTNIARHSDANLVEMNVEAGDEGELKMEIRDDGKPFQPNGGAKPGRGIANIRSRANLINADVDWAGSATEGNVFVLRIDVSSA